MALQAEQIHVAEFQHVRIRSPVDNVARGAAVHFYRRMLIDERPLFVGVALEAHGILRCSHPHLFGTFGAVWIVAIRALNQTLIHAVMEGHFKFSPLCKMAGIAKLWLQFDQQKFARLGMMNGVAGSTAYAVLRMNRIERVHVLGTASVTLEAARIDIFCGSFGEEKQLRNIGWIRDVSGSSAMTGLAAPVRWTLFCA